MGVGRAIAQPELDDSFVRGVGVGPRRSPDRTQARADESPRSGRVARGSRSLEVLSIDAPRGLGFPRRKAKAGRNLEQYQLLCEQPPPADASTLTAWC
jgi:hypothetical protein